MMFAWNWRNGSAGWIEESSGGLVVRQATWKREAQEAQEAEQKAKKVHSHRPPQVHSQRLINGPFQVPRADPGHWLLAPHVQWRSCDLDCSDGHLRRVRHLELRVNHQNLAHWAGKENPSDGYVG